MNLEWALMADGVAPADVYKVLGTDEGVDRAFKKLDTIKKDIVWWEAGAQGPQLLADGQVVFATSWNGRFCRRHQDRQEALQDHLGLSGPGLGLVGDPQGHAEARRSLPLHHLRVGPAAHGRPDQVDLLWPGQQGCRSD